ncbi:hypothetical protein [Evansella cellulosilytica]|uniref:Uncharacterized protein n=1 Tax=Evansella cellulosilytica (strain ATCC 21833 / DSM 2522 / FERM P-1141 / JCM 9156 / N-4) TaxID=649639 RepID=E6TZ59_EVAC2|nr:hypothetical protein [Evansella cellulosilytica]ADU28921.1 hypothetical protein Bcell_0639 [Evansella cellulosilytica DSM 2522]
MKFFPHCFAVASFIFTIIVCYNLGSWLNIAWLKYWYEIERPAKGVLFEAGGSIIPVILAIIAYYFTLIWSKKRLLMTKRWT